MSSEINKLVANKSISMDGVTKNYMFRLLRRREAAELFHESVGVVLRSLSSVFGHGGIGENGEGAMVSLLGALGHIDFETFWKIARGVLRGGAVEFGGKTVSFGDNLDECDYFQDYPEELYWAVYHGLTVNYPGPFSHIRGLLGGFGQQVKDALGQNTQSATTE